MSKIGDIYFRYVDSCNGPYCSEYEVIGETPCGLYISMGGYSKKWVGKTSRRPFVYSDKKDALVSYLHRKRKQIFILRQDANEALKHLKKALPVLEKEHPNSATDFKKMYMGKSRRNLNDGLIPDLEDEDSLFDFKIV